MMTEAETRDTLQHDLERGLHDLCQPLTILRGQLELGQMCGDRAALLEAVEGGLIETARMFRSIGEMRERLAKMSEQALRFPAKKEIDDGGSRDGDDATECGAGECGCRVADAVAG